MFPGFLTKGENMFNLEEKISEWRKQMLAAGIQTPVPLEELEIHLREEIELQIKSGTKEQHAFEIAVRQNGRAESIQCEFEKFNGKSKMSMVQGYRIYSRISMFLVGAFLLLLLACPPVSKTNGTAFFSFFSDSVQEFFGDYSYDWGLFYDLDFTTLRDHGQRIDVPVWFVEFSLIVAAAGTQLLAFRRRTGAKPVAG